ncbi:hypothetical protein ACFWEJ_17355 [Promicromonospora sp. NPDC060204]|uniref:hypothetical protein n=1 Tax=Promicromonospora sp. NPDC060204 TaxID=3347071 RepID=UPI00365574A0
MTLCTALVFSALLGLVTFDYLLDRQILADRGMRVDAWVVGYDWVRRGPDKVIVRPDDPPYFEATLSRTPGDLRFNDRIDVIYDPHAPGRVVAADEPMVDGWVLLVVGLDLLALVTLARGFAAARELFRRARTSRHHRTSPDARARTGHASGLLDRWRTPRIVLLLIFAPALGVAVAGLLTVTAVGDALALRASGVEAQATVVKSTWYDGGELEVRFPVQDGTLQSAQVPVREGAFFEGDAVDVVYEPAAPANARLAGPEGQGPWAYAALYVAVLVAAGGAVTVAGRTLIRRARATRSGPTAVRS